VPDECSLKKVLICSNVYPPHFTGGAELIAHYQSKALQARGFRIAIFAGDDSEITPRYAMAEDEYEGLPVFRIGLNREDFSWEYVNFFRPQVEQHFRRVLHAFSPDVVHVHNPIGLSAGIIRAAKAYGAKVVVTLHDHWGFCFKNTLLKSGAEICQDYSRCAQCMAFVDDGAQRRIPIRMRRDFLSLQLDAVDAFISPSLYLAETYVRAGLPVSKINRIWYGIDVERFSKVVKTPRPGKVRFTYIGYFGLHKGIHVLIEALRLIRLREALVLNLVGSVEFQPEIRERVESLGLSANVKFWGKVDHTHIESVLRETDVLILPSIWPENQPVTITEAMASKTAVIASDTGGIPELVINEETGYLFRPGSAVDLAERMLQFVAHPELIQTLGANGFERIKNVTYDRQVERIARIYN
jgi:glycosyltransferase involved in cell wall biosynthesis